MGLVESSPPITGSPILSANQSAILVQSIDYKLSNLMMAVTNETAGKITSVGTYYCSYVNTLPSPSNINSQTDGQTNGGSYQIQEYNTRYRCTRKYLPSAGSADQHYNLLAKQGVVPVRE